MGGEGKGGEKRGAGGEGQGGDEEGGGGWEGKGREKTGTGGEGRGEERRGREGTIKEVVLSPQWNHVKWAGRQPGGRVLIPPPSM